MLHKLQACAIDIKTDTSEKTFGNCKKIANALTGFLFPVASMSIVTMEKVVNTIQASFSGGS